MVVERRLVPSTRCGPKRSQPARARQRLDRRQPVGPRVRLRTGGQKQMASRGRVATPRTHFEDGRPRRRATSFNRHTVDDHRHVRRYTTVGQCLGEGPIHQSRRPHRVDSMWMLVVGKPFQPFPFSAVVVADHGRDLHVVGAVQDRQLAEDCAQQCPRGTSVAVDADMRTVTQIDGDRHVADHRALLDHPVQRRRRDGVYLVGGIKAGRDNPCAQRLVTDPHPDLAEVRILRAALPHSDAARQRPQRFRLRMPPMQ